MRRVLRPALAVVKASRQLSHLYVACFCLIKLTAEDWLDQVVHQYQVAEGAQPRATAKEPEE